VPTRIVQLETGGLLAALIQARIYLDYCEAGLAPNRGIHRVSPTAQQFVCETWLSTMKDMKIDLVNLFGYDPAMLRFAQNDFWLERNSEPHPGADYVPFRTLEEEMDQFVCLECNLTSPRRAAG
jgi:hypothetical protein